MRLRLLRVGLRTKLLLVALVLLAIPWSGYRFVQEMERYLRAGQEQAVAATAQAIATALNERARLFEPQAPGRSPWHEPGDLYLHALPTPIELDGSAADWPREVAQVRAYGAVDGSGTIHFRLRLGQYGTTLFALLEVSDPHLNYRNEGDTALDTADQVQIALTTPEGAFRRYAISPLRPGTGPAYLVALHEERLHLEQAEPRIKAVWREMPDGYAVEIALPLSLIGENLAFAVADVIEPEAGIAAWAGTSTVERREGMGRLVVPSPEIQELVAGLARTTSRIRVVDRSRRVIAEVGSLARAQESLARSAPADRWEALEARFLHPLYARILEPPAMVVEEQKAGARLESDEVEAALSGRAQIGRRALLDGRIAVVSATHPVWVGDQVFGAVVVEETTHAVVTMRNRALEQLFSTVLVAFVAVSLVLLLFATRLSWRIRRLRDEAEAAIDPQGRVRGGLTQSARARDELGDLSRSFSSVLAKLAQYHHYLEHMASRLSHELRTPVAVVRSSLDNLAAQPLPEEAKVYMARAQDGIDRLNRLLTRMTEARRLEQALATTVKERFDLAAVLTGCVEGYRAAYPGVTFNVHLPQGPVDILGAPDLVAQLLDKLVANAVDFHHPGTSIDIALTPEERHVTVSVADEGPPLPADMVDHLFQSMVSVRPQAMGTEPHLGFGLYIVRLIAAFHGGEATAANRPDGAGVVVTVRLPRP